MYFTDQLSVPKRSVATVSHPHRTTSDSDSSSEGGDDNDESGNEDTDKQEGNEDRREEENARKSPDSGVGHSIVSSIPPPTAVPLTKVRALSEMYTVLDLYVH